MYIAYQYSDFILDSLVTIGWFCKHRLLIWELSINSHTVFHHNYYDSPLGLFIGTYISFGQLSHGTILAKCMSKQNKALYILCQ